MRILFDSKKAEFKSPFGCLVPGQSCTLHIHIPETGDVIAVSSTGKIAVNDKVYKMAHTEQFLAQMLEILETPSVEK